MFVGTLPRNSRRLVLNHEMLLTHVHHRNIILWVFGIGRAMFCCWARHKRTVTLKIGDKSSFFSPQPWLWTSVSPPLRAKPRKLKVKSVNAAQFIPINWHIFSCDEGTSLLLGARKHSDIHGWDSSSNSAVIREGWLFISWVAALNFFPDHCLRCQSMTTIQPLFLFLECFLLVGLPTYLYHT